jgi:hypothetical protein
MFWIGMIVGVYIGTTFGFVVLALCYAASNGESEDE